MRPPSCVTTAGASTSLTSRMNETITHTHTFQTTVDAVLSTSEFDLERQVRPSHPASVFSFSTLKLNLVAGCDHAGYLPRWVAGADEVRAVS